MADPLDTSPLEHSQRVADYDDLVVRALKQRFGGADTNAIAKLNAMVVCIEAKLKSGALLNEDELFLIRLGMNMFAASSIQSLWRYTKKTMKQETNP